MKGPVFLFFFQGPLDITPRFLDSPKFFGRIKGDTSPNTQEVKRLEETFFSIDLTIVLAI